MLSNLLLQSPEEGMENQATEDTMPLSPDLKRASTNSCPTSKRYQMTAY